MEHSCNQKVIDALQAEVTRLSGKTSFCAKCNAYAKEIDRLKEALEGARLTIQGLMEGI